MIKTIFYLITVSICLIALSGCDKPDSSKYAFRAYDESQQLLASGKFHLHFNDGNVTGTFNVQPDTYFQPFSSGELRGSYTDSTFWVACPWGISDSGVFLQGLFEGTTIIGTVNQVHFWGTDVIGNFTLKPAD
ncbi:hypothetical protein F9K33_16350 [bacterium]|nr:MAG: hypothetical protein F9K33_16350 [bacterium]